MVFPTIFDVGKPEPFSGQARAGTHAQTVVPEANEGICNLHKFSDLQQQNAIDVTVCQPLPA